MRANLHLKEEEKDEEEEEEAQAWGEWSNILPKSSQARKNQPHHHCVNSKLSATAGVDYFRPVESRPVEFRPAVTHFHKGTKPFFAHTRA